MFPQDKPIRETSPALPTLSTLGWIRGMGEKVDRIFSYYLTSQYSQTTYHIGYVKSLQKTVKENYSNPFHLCNQIKDDLEFLLKPFLDYVDVKVDHKERETGPEYDIFIRLNIVHAGYKWERFKGLHMQNSKFTEIVNLDNYGHVSLT